MTDNGAKGVGHKVAVAVCSVLFYAFVFVYLYFFQGDLLATSQHILSQGATTYNHTVGAVLITIILALVQVGVARVAKLRGGAYALTFFPSSLVLAWLGGMTPSGPAEVVWSFSPWLGLLLLVLWLGACWVIRRVQSIGLRPESGVFFTSSMWRNVAILALQFCFIGLAANSDAVLHYRLRAETCLQRGDIDGALAAGDESLEADAGLTMVRAYALSLRGDMGEKLFRYPVAGTSDDLLPAAGRTQCLLLANDSIYKHLGARPIGTMTTAQYLAALRRDSLATAAVDDYELCAALVDRRLDDFVGKLLARYDSIDANVPRHYREALTLYTHLRSNPIYVYHDQAMDTDYADFRRMERSQGNDVERMTAVRPHYYGTYWWYYEYGAKMSAAHHPAKNARQ